MEEVKEHQKTQYEKLKNSKLLQKHTSRINKTTKLNFNLGFLDQFLQNNVCMFE